MTFAAITTVALTDEDPRRLGSGRSARTTIEARRGSTIAWQREVPGNGGRLARAGDRLIATLAARGEIGEVHGDPGAELVAFTAATGEPQWTRPIDASEYAIVTGIAALPDGGVVIGGVFGGTIRIGTALASSAGMADGFVARVANDGTARWIVRVGGTYADAVQGVAIGPDGTIAIAGTFAPTAELAGKPLASLEPKSRLADGFVATLDGDGKPRWVQTFGGKADEAIAGVAIDGAGHVAVAGSLRQTVHVGNQELVAAGGSDGLVAVYGGADGAFAGAVRIGGDDLDGIDGIVALASGFVVGGFYSGTLAFGARQFVAGGGDDAFVAQLSTTGELVAAWQIGGNGREQIAAIAPAPGGYVVGVGHTDDLVFDGAKLPAPHDPLGGAALIVRAARQGAPR